MKKQPVKKWALADGVLLVDKPATWTSHDVCHFIRKRFNIKKVGHAGTLDPMATGLLVVLLGKATKFSGQLITQDKAYNGVMRLGVRTDSHDRDGKVLGEAPWESVTLEEVEKKAQLFRGDIHQVPPMLSALKHEGVRLYKLARQGKEVPREARAVRVHKLEIGSKNGAQIDFSVCVSKGTYVRTLINDLGQELGCLAMLETLRRTRCGDYAVEKSVTISELKQMELEDLRPKIFPLHTLSYYATSHRS